MKALLLILSFITLTVFSIQNVEAAAWCNSLTQSAQEDVNSAFSGGDEFLALQSSQEALSACTGKAKEQKLKELRIALTNMKKVCDGASDQMSELFKATCYLRAAEFAANAYPQL